MPDAPWLMTQSWNRLLFAHWPVDAAQMRRVVPKPFELDVFDGRAWLGVVPFYMSNVGVRATPRLPWLSSFPELNVRTYVRLGDRPGVYFFGLDAGSRVAVAAARVLLNLPYHSATMRVGLNGVVVDYRSVRRSDRSEFRAVYAPTGLPFRSSAGSLEHFLTERYCLYHRDQRGRPYRLEIHHRPWSLQVAKAAIGVNTIAAASGIAVDRPPQLLHFALRQDVVAWAPNRLPPGG